MSARFLRLAPGDVVRRLAATPEPLVLDVRREEAFAATPLGIGGAVPVVLDRQPIRLPDVARDRPIIAYCL